MALRRIVPENISTTLSTRIRKEYMDIDNTLSIKPGTLFEDGVKRGDIYKKKDIRAVEQSIHNILLTNHFEKPFNPFFGANLRRLLFELDTTISESEVVDMIARAIKRDEPRVSLSKVILYDASAERSIPRGIENIFFYSARSGVAEHTLQITVFGTIKNTGQEITTEVSMSRLR